jgi:regulator of sirC expression with transglutaminase-like and TPR domain
MPKRPAINEREWFSRDAAFLDLLRGEADVVVVALEIARDRFPGLDFAPTLDWIRERGMELHERLTGGEGGRRELVELAGLLAGERGITGSSDAYRSADGSCLNRVVETGTGLPLTLSMLYVAVAREAGLKLGGVCSPGHFLARREGDEGEEPLFVDAFQEGRVLTLDEAVDRAREFAEGDREALEGMLAVAGNRAIVARMLNNLKAAYARVEDWDLALTTQRRLTALLPDEHSERRDLGLICLKKERFGEGLAWLESCLATARPEERPVLEQQCRIARGRVAAWN